MGQQRNLIRSVLRAFSAGCPRQGVWPETLDRKKRVSRHTVREALRQLNSLGVVKSHQGKGTSVTARDPLRYFASAFGSADELLQHAALTRLVDISLTTGTVERDLKDRIGFGFGQEYLRCDAIRVSGDGRRQESTAKMEIFFAGAFAGIRDQIGKYPFTIVHLIEREYGLQIAEIRQQVKAVAVDTSIAQALGVEPGSPGLEVQRWFFDAEGAPFEYSRGVYHLERYSSKSTLRAVRSDE